MPKRIFLTGFMGSGKSRIGRLLAKRLDINFIDTDEIIVQKYNQTIRQMFDEFGEKKFRKIESEIIVDLIKDYNSAIFALGGGSLISKTNLDIVKKSGMLIFIQSGLKAIWQRTKNNTERPLLLENGEIPAKAQFLNKTEILLRERQPGYQNAHIIIDRDGKEAEDVVEEILAKLITYRSSS